MSTRLLTSANREEYLDQVRREIAGAERFILVTAFATADGIELLEPAFRSCVEKGGAGTIVLALDRQHFNAAEVFERLAQLQTQFGQRLEVRLVEEREGLLHAKAVFAKRPDGTSALIVGSANLTTRAFTRNHELGMWVDLLDAPVARDFERFVGSLGGKRLDADAIATLAADLRGVRGPRSPGPARAPSPQARPFWSDAELPPIDVTIDTFVGDWLRAGSIVGRGRRGLDALVIRAPAEQLERQGLVEREFRTRLGKATDKTVRAGHQIRLLPDEEDAALRKDAHAVQNLLAKLTLNLPCFGLWMPASFWEVFVDAQQDLQARSISAEQVCEAAARRRLELSGAGMEPEVDAMVASLLSDRLAKPTAEVQLRAELLRYFSEQLARRTPDLVARAVGFRTQRQAIASNLDLRAVARSFFVDLVQATLSATYRTGSWPRRFRSCVAREFAVQMAKWGAERGVEPNGAFALQLLDRASSWEGDELGLERVAAEVKSLLGDPRDLPRPTKDDLIGVDEDTEEGDEDG